jgi:hypothetical protein
MQAQAVWNAGVATELRRVRRSRRQSQQACAVELASLGAESASQPNVSMWETGATQTPNAAAIAAVADYLSIHQPVETADQSRRTRGPLNGGSAINEAADGRQNAGPGRRTGDEVVSRAAAHSFDGIVREVTGEPLLGPGQQKFVDGIIKRLTDGPGMSAADLEMARETARWLGLTDDAWPEPD